MKRCPYCGKEYPDEVARCFIDNYSLTELVVQENAPSQTPDSSVALPDSRSVLKPDTTLAYPDYRWSASDAWKCLGMFLVIGFLLSTGISVMDTYFPAFHRWRRSGLGYVSHDLLRFNLFLLTAAYF
jgi:hypothetical protein